MTEHHRTASWQKVRAKWRPRIAATLPAPCIDCGQPVSSDQVWQVGHRVSVARGTAMGWTRQEIDAGSNLGPSHGKNPGMAKACNQRAGGREGAIKTNTKRKTGNGLAKW